MGKTVQEPQWPLADERLRKSLPPGVNLVCTLRGHSQVISRIAWSPDGQMLASPSDDGTIRIWDVTARECLQTLKHDDGAVRCVAFDREGRTLASGGVGGTVYVRDISKGRTLCTLEQTRSGVPEVLSLAFAPVGRSLAIGTLDNKILLWSANKLNDLTELDGCNNSAVSVTFDYSGQRLAASSLGLIASWHPRVGAKGHLIDAGSDWVVSLAAHPHLPILASAGFDKVIRMWDWDKGKLLLSLEGHTGIVRSIAFDPGGNVIASMADDGSLRLWNSERGECLAVIHGPTVHRERRLPGLAFHPTTAMLACVGSELDTEDNQWDRVIHIYELHLPTLGCRTRAAKHKLH